MQRLVWMMTIVLLAGCATGPTAFDRDMATLRAQSQREWDELPWKSFQRQGGVEYCARKIAFDRLPLIGDCEKFKDKYEIVSKAEEIRADFEKLNLKPATAKLVKAGKIRIGMTKAEVRMSRGTPYTVNKTVTAHSEHEQWVYGDDYNSKTYLYFDDGLLTAWQR
jgi:hypothetical protein